MTDLIPSDLLQQMIQNHHDVHGEISEDHAPVVMFQMEGLRNDLKPTWLISEIDPFDNDTMFGLCDLGFGFPELGYVSLAEITSIKHPLTGQSVVQAVEDFKGTYPMSVYLEAAHMCDQITVEPDTLASAHVIVQERAQRRQARLAA